MAETEPRSIAARIAWVCALAWPISAAVGIALAHFRVVPPLTGFGLAVLAIPLALTALIAGLVGFFRNKNAPALRKRSVLGAAIGGLGFAAGLYLFTSTRGVPPINDITTSPSDPPAFEALTKEGPNVGRDMSYPTDFAEQQQAAYADLAPVVLAQGPAEALPILAKVVQDAGLVVVAKRAPADETDSARLEATHESKLFRFVDDLVVRIRPTGGGSVVDIRSKSRDGRSDLGANAARIRTIVRGLK